MVELCHLKMKKIAASRSEVKNKLAVKKLLVNTLDKELKCKIVSWFGL